jgi:hypothetical protein
METVERARDIYGIAYVRGGARSRDDIEDSSAAWT